MANFASRSQSITVMKPSGEFGEMRGEVKRLNFVERQLYHEQKRQIKIRHEQLRKEDAELDGCTFAPTIAPLPTEAVQHQVARQEDQRLQSYLEGMSYGGQSEEDSAMRLAGEQVNYVNNL